MNIADFYSDTVTVSVTHRGRTFDVECYPERSTRALAAEAERISNEAGEAESEWHILNTLVASWTLADEFCEASALRMSQGLRLAIIRAVNREALFPTMAVSAEDSSTISAHAASTENSLDGTPSPTA